jgi:hypothetical protein
VFADAVAQGTNARLSLSASVTPDSAQVGLDLRVFALAWVPSNVSAQGPQGRWFARTPEGWVPVVAGEVWPQWVALSPLQPSAQGPVMQALPVLEAEDMRTFLGADIYIGYGVASGTAPWPICWRNTATGTSIPSINPRRTRAAAPARWV